MCIRDRLGGLALGQVPFGAGTVAAIAVLAAFVYLLARPNKYNADYRRKALNLPVKERA